MTTEQRLSRIESVVASRQPGVVVLEDIHDPHNAEAVFRTCDAFGIQQVHIIFRREKPFKPRKIGKSSSSSANKWLDFTLFDSTEECLSQLKAAGYELVATALQVGAESIYEAKLDNPLLALMFGNEHRGLSGEALAAADRVLSIPMTGMVQSLNLSVTAAIVLYEVTRQRQITDGRDYRLPPAQLEALLDDFKVR